MTIFTNGGRAIFAQLLKERHQADPYSVFVAFGSGEPWWGEVQTELVSFDAGDLLTTAHPHATNATVPGAAPVVVTSPDGVTLYVAGVDYTATPVTGSVSRLDGGAIPAEAEVKLVYTADIPAPARTDAGLVNEVGRVRVLSLDYLLPLDEVAEPNPITVSVDGTAFAIRTDPTRYLYASANLAADQATGPDISEFALIVDAAVDGGLPPGQIFYSGAEITEAGTPVLIKRAVPAPHSGAHSLGAQMTLEI